MICGRRTNDGKVEVTIGGADLDSRTDLVNHSPDGFEWGYSGSGPSQLSLAIVAAVAGDGAALGCYRKFREACVSKIAGDSWQLPVYMVKQWVEHYEKNAGDALPLAVL